MIDRALWNRFYEIYAQYRSAWDKYSDGEISFDLDVIADGLLPILLSNLFVSWFPMLENVILLEAANGIIFEHEGYEAYEYWWCEIDKEELYQLFDEALKETRTEGT